MKGTLPMFEVTAAGFGSETSSLCQSSAVISETKWALFCVFLGVWCWAAVRAVCLGYREHCFVEMMIKFLSGFTINCCWWYCDIFCETVVSHAALKGFHKVMSIKTLIKVPSSLLYCPFFMSSMDNMSSLSKDRTKRIHKEVKHQPWCNKNPLQDTQQLRRAFSDRRPQQEQMIHII